MIDFLSGAVTIGYMVAALFFVRFWRKTADRLFLAFAIAFVLLALNQGFAQLLDVHNEPSNGFIYGLRVLGFMLILLAILDKNLFGGGKN
jgi:Family of unknown function (DUF5985)